MPFTDLTNPPTAPNRSMTNDEFIDAADAFVAWWVQFAGTDLPTFINELEATAALIEAAPAVADPGLTAIAGLTPAADRGVYFTGATTAALFTLTTAARSLLDDASGDDMMTTLGMSAAGKTLVKGANSAAQRLTLDVYSQAEVDAAVAAAQAAASVPAGAVQAFAMETAPTGWLKANGATVSRTTYADLYAAIGDTFGAGDGSTTFELPDLRGEFIRGWADTRLVDTGRALGSFQADELKSHTHTIESGEGSTGVEDGAGGTSNDTTTSSTGGTETRPRNIALLYCIKT